MITLHAIGKLTLEIDDNDLAMGAIIHDDIGELVRLQVFPSWCNPAPLVTAEIVLRSMRPSAPAYLPNVSESRSADGEHRAGCYNAPSDEVTVYDRDSRTPGELAEILLHECGHAVGHPARTARWVVGVVDPDAPEVFTGHSGEDSRHEEAVASLTGHIVAIRLGITCRFNLAPIHFLNHMSYLPVERLAEVVSQAQRGARFLLNTTTITTN